MKHLIACIVLAGCVVAGEPAGLSPAQSSIKKAEEQIAKQPGHYPYYNELAMAFARRARETSDVAWYGKAEETLKQSFAIAPANFEGLKVQTWLLLGRHEFARALESATTLNKRVPDDITVYGYMADANAELGNYADAVAAAQWMLNLRPGNIAGLTRAAYLRELHGDISGAAELMQMAYDATPYQQAEDRAWLLTQLAHLDLLAGDLAGAETHANGALSLFPNYHYALGALGQVRLAQKRYGDACTLFRRRYEAAPHAENLYALAEALHLAGREQEAAAAFADFERNALKESGLADNANHELMSYYADHAGKPAEALKIAREELGRRHDAFTLDGYAWALAKSGDYAVADVQMRKALAFGVKDPRILYHAGAIALKLNRPEEAERLLRDAAARFSPEAAKLLSRSAGPGERSGL
jgi:tetratricopeptide (TPR) repeat protein